MLLNRYKKNLLLELIARDIEYGLFFMNLTYDTMNRLNFIQYIQTDKR
jgi:hypothetical protein